MAGLHAGAYRLSRASLVLLGVALAVAPVREVFRFGALSAYESSIALATGVATIAFLEAIKAAFGWRFLTPP